MSRDLAEIISIDIPRIIKNGSFITITLRDKYLLHEYKFIRIDAYPSVNPIHNKRHYGYIDIQLPSANDIIQLKYENNFLINKESKYNFSNNFNEFGECVWHFLLFKNDISQELIITKHIYLLDDGYIYKPKRFIVSISTLCNLNCVMCDRHSLKEQYYYNTVMDVNDINQISDYLKNSHEILLLGCGEPLLNKNIFNIIKCLRRIIDCNGKISTSSNGTVLNEQISHNLLDSSLNAIGFSVDGASSATYDTIRRGANFDKVFKNIQSFMHILHQKNMLKNKFNYILNKFNLANPLCGVHVWTNFVIQPANYFEIIDFIKQFGDIGIKDMRFNHMIPWVENGRQMLQEGYAHLGHEIGEFFSELAQKAHETARNYDIHLAFEEWQSSEDNKSSLNKDGVELICPFTEFAVVNPDKIIQLCCNEYGVKLKKQLINGKIDPFMEMRMKLATGDWPELCIKCKNRIFV